MADLVMRILLDVGQERLEVAATLVEDRVGLVVALEPVKSGESRHVHAFDVDLVGRRVHLGDDHIVVVGQLSSQLVVDGRELLAVSAPEELRSMM